MDYKKIMELKGNEDGEALDLKAAFQWILRDMSYDDFRSIMRVSFYDKNAHCPFNYFHNISQAYDTPKTRKKYIKYLLYKIVQNINDPRVDSWY